jgi:tRNA (mo5U34)-methyltransferase
MGTAGVLSSPDIQDQIQDQIKDHLWIHTIDLGHGVTTPGRWAAEHKLHLMQALDTLDLRGKKVLDIGCLDGLFTFEAERRGAAEIYATDLVTQVYPPRDTTFQVAHRILESKASYHPDVSVFDIGSLGVNDFDVVLYLGVYYHLRDPLLAFARLRQVMKEGALIVIEGEVLANVETSLAHYFYKKPYALDRSNWWVPSIPCFREWVESSFFEIVADLHAPLTYSQHYGNGFITGRHTLIAKAVNRADYFWAFPDPELRKYDLNDYGNGPS